MYRVKETQKNHFNVWTNKSSTNCKDGTLPNVSMNIQKLKSKATPESNANQESKTFQVRKSYLGQKNNPESETNQELKAYQKPKNNQAPKAYQKPRSYQGQNNNLGQRKYEWQKVNYGKKYKRFNQGSKSYQGSKAYHGLKSCQFPTLYQKPRIYQPEEPFKKSMKYKNYKVPEISVSELCRTLSGLKAMEQAKNNNDSANLNDKSNSYDNNYNDGNSQPNEPFFASNLEYYPHLPQIYYSQEYQTFAELKASVCQGDLTQVKPPVNYDFHFIKEWRETFQTTEQRQAYLRNQRALNAQLIGREQRHQREQQMQEHSESKAFGSGLVHVGPPPIEERFPKDSQKTCHNVSQQQELCLQQALKIGLYMPAQRGMELQMCRQKVEKDHDLENEQKQEETEPEQEKPVLCCFLEEQQKLSAQQQELRLQQALKIGLYMPAQRGMELQMRRQEVEKEHELEKEQKQEETEPEQEKPVLCCFLEEQQKLSARFLKDQQELEDRRQKEKDQKELIACLHENQDLQNVKEIEARKQKEKEEQQELEARIQRQKKAMEFVLQLQREFEEQKKLEELEARRRSEQKRQEEEAEARCQERDLYQAQLRNERARTAQRVSRETRRYYEQRQYDFRFGPKDLGQGGSPTQVTIEYMSDMPTVPAIPRAPFPSELPKPMPSMFSGKTPFGTENGIKTGNGNKYPEEA